MKRLSHFPSMALIFRMIAHAGRDASFSMADGPRTLSNVATTP
jgi:hypothetical protein